MENTLDGIQSQVIFVRVKAWGKKWEVPIRLGVPSWGVSLIRLE